MQQLNKNKKQKTKKKKETVSNYTGKLQSPWINLGAGSSCKLRNREQMLVLVFSRSNVCVCG